MRRYQRTVDRIGALRPEVIVGCHSRVIEGDLCGEAIAATGAPQTGGPAARPDGARRHPPLARQARLTSRRVRSVPRVVGVRLLAAVSLGGAGHLNPMLPCSTPPARLATRRRAGGGVRLVADAGLPFVAGAAPDGRGGTDPQASAHSDASLPIAPTGAPTIGRLRGVGIRLVDPDGVALGVEVVALPRPCR